MLIGRFNFDFILYYIILWILKLLIKNVKIVILSFLYIPGLDDVIVMKEYLDNAMISNKKENELLKETDVNSEDMIYY